MLTRRQIVSTGRTLGQYEILACGPESLVYSGFLQSNTVPDGNTGAQGTRPEMLIQNLAKAKGK